MSLVVNNNMMAANTARNLNAHYGRLATSTQRLSSGLRVNSAADDAAGLAIRELQRADIAALQQGARNANDAISMIQVADGSLGIIDEKLIRMKELAEQAATGTYDSTQRLMIESEYQAMASEITRIANATDFNGTKLLDGTLAGDHDGSGLISEGKMKIHFGTGNDSAEDYYYVEIGECTSEALGLGNNSTWQDVQRRGVEAFKESLQKQIKNDKTLSDAEKGELLAQIDENADLLKAALESATDPTQAFKFWGSTDEIDLRSQIEKAVNDQTEPTPDASGTCTSGDITTWFTAVKNALDKAIDDNGVLTADERTSAKAMFDVKVDPLDTGVDLTSAEFAELKQQVISAAKGSLPDIASRMGFMEEGKNWIGNSELMSEYMAEATKAYQEAAAYSPTEEERVAAAEKVYNAVKEAMIQNKPAAADFPYTTTGSDDPIFTKIADAAVAAAKEAGFSSAAIEGIRKAVMDEAVDANGNGKAISTANWTTLETDLPGKFFTPAAGGTAAALGASISPADANQAVRNAMQSDRINEYWNGLRTTEKQKLQYAWGQAAVYNLANAEPTRQPGGYGIEAGAFTFKNAEMLEKAFDDMQAKIGHMDFAGFTVETQEDAQMALDAINEAIVSKDKIRAHLGAAQNRLENTVSNLNIQAENLQAAESRISDVDVATEMTEFVRNQILTQSAVAMLSQANSLPQMAMQLIGG